MLQVGSRLLLFTLGNQGLKDVVVNLSKLRLALLDGE